MIDIGSNNFNIKGVYTINIDDSCDICKIHNYFDSENWGECFFIDGSTIRNCYSLCKGILIGTGFKGRYNGVVDSFVDLMCDLSWTGDVHRISVILYNLDSFLIDSDQYDKNLARDILGDVHEFWNSELIKLYSNVENFKIIILYNEKIGKIEY